MRPGTPEDCIRDAMLTVSPPRSNRMRCRPITPPTSGPLARPDAQLQRAVQAPARLVEGAEHAACEPDRGRRMIGPRLWRAADRPVLIAGGLDLLDAGVRGQLVAAGEE